MGFGFVTKIIADLPDPLALAATLCVSFTAWLLWGIFWFPVVDWVYAQWIG